MERNAEMRYEILGNPDVVKFSHTHVKLSDQDDRERWWLEELEELHGKYQVTAAPTNTTTVPKPTKEQKSLTKLIPGFRLKWTPPKPDDTGHPEQRSGEQLSTKGSILALSGIL